MTKIKECVRIVPLLKGEFIVQENSYQFSLDIDSAIILANMKKEDKTVQEQYEKKDEYIYLENPIQRINETNY